MVARGAGATARGAPGGAGGQYDAYVVCEPLNFVYAPNFLLAVDRGTCWVPAAEICTVVGTDRPAYITTVSPALAGQVMPA